MFMLGFFWKRTTGTAGIVGLLVGFILSVFFNEAAPSVLGNETFLYTAFPNDKGSYEIPFLICMGLAFGFAVLAMVLVSLLGPKEDKNAFEIDASMFKVDARTAALIAITLLVLSAI